MTEAWEPVYPHPLATPEDAHRWAAFARGLLGPRRAGSKPKSSLSKDDVFGPVYGPPEPGEPE